MAANTKIAGPNFAGIMAHAEGRGNKSGSAAGMAKVPLMATRIKGGAANTPSPTKSVITPSQPTAGAIRGNVGKSGTKMAPYDQTPNPRKPASYRK